MIRVRETAVDGVVTEMGADADHSSHSIAVLRTGAVHNRLRGT